MSLATPRAKEYESDRGSRSSRASPEGRRATQAANVVMCDSFMIVREPAERRKAVVPRAVANSPLDPVAPPVRKE